MAGKTDNAIVIDAPMDLVWSMTDDVPSWPELFSEYASTQVLSRSGSTITFRLTMRPDEQGNSWSWVSARSSDPTTYTVRSHRVETGFFEFMNIYWEFTAVEGGVRMRWVQDFHMKDTAPLDDDAMTLRLNTNTAVQMSLIKDRIEAAALAAVPG